MWTINRVYLKVVFFDPIAESLSYQLTYKSLSKLFIYGHARTVKAGVGIILEMVKF